MGALLVANNTDANNDLRNRSTEMTPKFQRLYFIAASSRREPLSTDELTATNPVLVFCQQALTVVFVTFSFAPLT
jgi:hypothetical protein